jgi:hypothetical protein
MSLLDPRMNVAALNSPGWSWFRLWVRPRDVIAPENVLERLQVVFAASQRERVARYPADTPRAPIEAALSGSRRAHRSGADVADRLSP